MNQAAALLEPDNPRFREPDTRRFRWVGRLARRADETPMLDPVAEELAAEARERRSARMSARNRRASVAIAGGFLAAAGALALVVPSGRTPSAWTVLLLVASYAIASRIEFEVGAGSAVPTELVLVPMLFLLPLGQVPLWVALSYLLGSAPELLKGSSVERALIPVCGCWHAVGVVAVLAVAGERGPRWHDAPIYAAALGAQFVFDFGSAAARDRLAHGIELGVLARYLRWVFLVDAMLAPIGLAIAFSAAAQPVAAALALPLIALLAVFARERKARIDHALELSGAYRGTGLLAETYHEILGEESLERALERIADTISSLIPVGGVRVATRRRRDVPERSLFERGTRPADVTGLVELELPMIARGRSEGTFSVWRAGEAGPFDGDECQLVAWFADAAALALDNARSRSALERRAESDSLTMLLNHRAFQERLRAELAAVRAGEGTAALLLLDIDDFKRINDVHGHAVGDQVLARIAAVLRATVRAEDHACRIGGEEFAVVIPGGDAAGAFSLANRIAAELASTEIQPVGTITVSIGIAEAPRHAQAARDLAVCADAAMLTAKASGKSRAVVFDPSTRSLPYVSSRSSRDEGLRSVAHLKLLQSLASTLNRLNDVALIGAAIVEELRTLIDYHACRVYVAEGELLVPVAMRGEHDAYRDETVDALVVRVGEGVTGTAVARRESILVPDAERCEFAVQVPGTEPVEESMVAVPLLHGPRANGAIVISKLGLEQFDESDVRLLEVLAGYAAAAIENARLLETVREQAEQLEQDLVATVEALATAAAPSTARETADLAVALGRELGLEADELRLVELGAFLREIDDRLVSPIAGLRDARAVARQTTERWDGTGGPGGLARESIPLASRIVAVAAACSSLRDAGHADRDIRRLMQRDAGRRFDPSVVAVLNALLGRAGQLSLLSSR